MVEDEVNVFMGVDFKHSVVDIQVTRSMYDVVIDHVVYL